ncbi:3-oxoacyl-[acyl-carrier-protein] synthase 2 [Anaerohalosphaera lusitana]|uniref:3-oxoacyl-[acyl-carrier-protein] synthase 2 n=1 Tax=Anaerohalosphaera lusitana TaxID=1936003 RepID=A0A1U9NLX9_9BACT|nr:beta-ketoacyl-[acyl-carrier-protein] synthase family protein [Anaerohalosphaera lusitana]AQT68835.1 3-oxoacyl-[acyl-carrier-protein] synthase 2 [Anaerohalosphaera lusitana]
MSKRRIAITGVGATTPLGLTAGEMWEGLLEGRSGIDKIQSFDPAGFPCRIAGETPAFKVRKHVPKTYRKATKLMSRDIELSILAANDAIETSGLVTKAAGEGEPTIDPERFAINMGAGLISCDLEELAPCVAASLTDGEFDLKKWGTEGLNYMTPLWLLKYLPNMLPCHVGIIHDMQGPSNTITCGEVSSHVAITEAAQVIARGDADAAMAGGCEAKVNPIVLLRQCLLKRATSDHNGTPDEACRPFDAEAKGSVFGEAAGLVVLEELEGAKSRGAKIYAEIAGAGASNSLASSYEHSETDGKGIEIAIRKATKEAGIDAGQIDLVVPHGTGIPADDAAEAKAISRVLGERTAEVPVWPIKSMTSNAGAGAGSLDVIATAMAISEGKIGAAKNFEQPFDGCELNISKQVQEVNVRYALCCGYTFGGQTAALILKNTNGEV